MSLNDVNEILAISKDQFLCFSFLFHLILNVDFNLRPGGGLLGLRYRQRESEQQQSQSSIATQSHPAHLPRTILGNNSILDKDSRSDFRERSVLGGSSDDRFDRIDRIDRIDRMDRIDRIDRLDRNDRGDRRPFNRDRDRDRDYGR